MNEEIVFLKSANQHLRSRLAEVEKERDRIQFDAHLFADAAKINMHWVDATEKKLAEAQESHESALAKLGNELFKVKEELLAAKAAIFKKDFALRLAMNAFEKRWCIDWGQVESAISEGFDAARAAEEKE